MSTSAPQRCTRNGPYTEVQVPSHSEPGKTYNVLVVDPEDPEESICECEGFSFRGICKHLDEAVDELCYWDSNQESQSMRQKIHHICPRCGGPTEEE